MEAVAGLLQDLGGYGVAGLLFYLRQQSETERMRYRDNYEKVLAELPELANALKELTDAVDKRNNKSIQTSPH